MLFDPLLRSWLGSRPSTTVRPPRPAARLQVEGLEDRLQPSGGALDPTFGASGLVTTDFGSTNDLAADAVLQSDGKVVAVGRTTTGSGTVFAVGRYLPNGALDSSFGSGGKVATNATIKGPESAQAVALQADGKIVVVGTATVGQTRNTMPTIYDNALVVVRYNANGTLDKTFNKTGTLLINPTSGGDEGRAVTIQPDGKILIGGWANYRGTTGNDFFLARLTTAGVLDSTFGSGGMVTTDFTEFLTPRPGATVSMDSLHQIRVLSDGRILAAGGADAGFALARYNPNGSLDSTFGTGGKVSVPVGFSVDNDRISLGFSQGRLVLGGTLWNYQQGQFDLVVARTDAAGTLDTAFGGTGLVTFGLGTFGRDTAEQTTYDERIGGLVVQADGKVAVAGYRLVSQWNGTYMQTTGRSVLLVRFTDQGTLDQTFGSGGEVSTSVGTSPQGSGAAALLLQPDGKLLVAGFTTRTTATGTDYDFLLARYLPASPQIGSFTANPSPATVDNPVTLTAANVQALNPGSTITQVAFYADSNDDGKLDPTTDTLLGYGVETSTGTWTYSFTFSTAGTYKLFAQAMDKFGVLSDPLGLDLEVL